MQEAMLESEDFESTQSAAHAQFDLSVALHLGQLVVAAGNISGDVVDEIAMLALESEPGQILATEALVAALRGDSKELVKGVQAQTRTLGAKPMGTFEVSRRPADQGPVEKTLTQQPPTKAPTLPLQAAPAPARTPAPAKVTQAATTPVRTPAAGGRTLQLSYEGTHLDLDEASPTLTIGRSPNNGLVVKSPHISRTHAVIEFSEGAFYLVNQSANGSCLKAQGHDEVPCTERLVLEGKGVIGLGPDFTRCGGQLIEYRLL
jgi:predicted component of type VI protein secretion system